MNVEDLPNGKQLIAVDELPYNVNKARLIEHIAGLVQDKTITGISDIRDDSDKKGLRIAIELKRGEIPDVVINQLYKYSDMQVTFGCNMLALDKGLPRTMNIKQFITCWINHRIEVIRRRTRFELKKAEARAHILEGYLKALDHLDEVIKIIRGSENKEIAKTELKNRFEFTEKQATAVLELRLYQLTGLEKEKVENEYQELLKKIANFKAILASEQMVKDIIRDELDSLAVKNHKSERRTKIVAAEGEFSMEDLIADEVCVLTVSSDDYIKRMPITSFKEQKRGGQGVIGLDMKKESDTLKEVCAVSTHDHLLIFTSLGRVYWLKAWQVPEAGRRTKGKPIINLLEDLKPDEKLATILPVKGFDIGGSILLTTHKGITKKTLLESFSNPRRKGVFAINIDEGDHLIAARYVTLEQQVMVFTRLGMAVRFDQAQVRDMGRTARGVKAVNLKDPNDCVVSVEIVTGDETILVVCENGYGKRSKVDHFRQTNRGGVGVRSIITSMRNGYVVGAVKVKDEDSVLLMSTSGQALLIRMKDLRVLGRSTQGVRLATLKDGKLIGIQKIEAVEPENEEK